MIFPIITITMWFAAYAYGFGIGLAYAYVSAVSGVPLTLPL